MENEELETGEAPETTGGDTTSGDDSGSGDDTSKDSDQSTDETQSDNDNESDSGSEPTLTPEEQARRDELLAGTKGTDKEADDLRSELGRERKKREEERQTHLAIIDALSKGGDAKPTSESESEEPELYTPSAPFLNEDGSINREALDEWNFRGNQFLESEIDKLKETVKELGGNVDNIHLTAKEKQEAAEFQKRFGLSEEQYRNYKDIKETRGDLDAIEYLEIEKKEAQAIKAAASHRDKERGAGALSFGNDGAPPAINSDTDALDKIVKEINTIPAGDERAKALAEIPFKYPQEISSQILRLVAHSQ